MKETSVQITNAERLQNVTISPVTRKLLVMRGRLLDIQDDLVKLIEEVYLAEGGEEVMNNNEKERIYDTIDSLSLIVQNIFNYHTSLNICLNNPQL